MPTGLCCVQKLLRNTQSRVFFVVIWCPASGCVDWGFLCGLCMTSFESRTDVCLKWCKRWTCCKMLGWLSTCGSFFQFWSSCLCLIFSLADFFIDLLLFCRNHSWPRTNRVSNFCSKYHQGHILFHSSAEQYFVTHNSTNNISYQLLWQQHLCFRRRFVDSV